MVTHHAPRSTPRRALLLGGVTGVVGAAALSGCTGRHDSGPDWEALGEEPERYRAEAGTRPGRIETEDPRGLESSVGRLVVTGAERRAALEPQDAVSLSDGVEEPPEPVSAPDGEEFLLVELDVEDVQWRLAESIPPPRTRFVLRRGDGEVTTPVAANGLVGTWLLRVAADPAPEDAVLEVVEFGRTQRLSLVDGSLVHTDVPHLYGRSRLVGEDWPGGGIALEGEQAPEAVGQSAEDERGDRDSVALQALSARDLPMSRARGWAADGERLLRLEIDTWHRVTRRDDFVSVLLPVDLSRSVLRLPDGGEREPVRLEDSRHLPEWRELGGTVVLWFSVPVDTSDAEVLVRATPFPRREGLAEELAASCAMTIPLTFEPPQ